MARVVGGLRRCAIRVKEVSMRYEEDYDIVGAFEERDIESESDTPDESDDDFADLDFDSGLSDESEMAEDAVEEEFDEED